MWGESELLPAPPPAEPAAQLRTKGHRPRGSAVLLLSLHSAQNQVPLLQARPDSGEGSLPPRLAPTSARLRGVSHIMSGIQAYWDPRLSGTIKDLAIPPFPA